MVKKTEEIAEQKETGLAIQKPLQVIQFEESIKQLTTLGDKKLAAVMYKVLVMWQSGLCPTDIDNPQKAFMIAQYGAELGIGPARSFKHIYVTKGKPACDGAVLGAIARKQGIKWHTVKDFEKATGPTPGMAKTFVNRTTRIEFRHGEMKEYGEFSRKDAVKISGGKKGQKLIDKDNYKNWEAVMYWWRAFAIGVRRIDPGSFGSFYLPDELDIMMGPDGAKIEDTDYVDMTPDPSKPPHVSLDNLDLATPTLKDWVSSNLEDIKLSIDDEKKMKIIAGRAKQDLELPKNTPFKKILEDITGEFTEQFDPQKAEE